MSTDPSTRVVVTGMAINTPLGDTPAANVDAMLAGRSAVTRWKTLSTDRIDSKIGADLSDYDAAARVEALSRTLPPQVGERLAKVFIKAPFSTRLAMLLAVDAFADAGVFERPLSVSRVATLLAGHNVNENYTFENRTQFDEEPDWIDAMLTIGRLDTDQAACASQVLGLRGPMYTVGAACASGNAALRLAVDEVRYRDCDAALVIGPVLDFNPMDLHAMAIIGAISCSSFNDEPERASRPFDTRREGFVPAHGGAALLVESLASARRREATIHAEIFAVGASNDANHLPNPSEESQVALMGEVLDAAGMRPEEVDYVNAHATSTPAGDVAEARSIRRVFGAHCNRLKVNAPKSMLGHCCWSAPLVETVTAIEQMRRGRLHPSINVDELDAAVDIDVCANEPVAHEVRRFMKTSFGFGGINSVSLLGRMEKA